MKLNHQFLSILTCLIIVINFQIQSTIAQTRSQIEDAAYSILVQIVSPSITQENKLVLRGSGVIIKNEGRKYYVITNSHVIDDDSSYKIRLNRTHPNPYDIEIIKQSSGQDLALLSFISYQNHKVAELGSNEIDPNPIYVAGFTSRGEDYRFDFTSGKIINIDSNYNLQYNNRTNNGMSGGPVLDQNGFLIGIHKGVRKGISITNIRQFLNDPIPSIDQSSSPLLIDNPSSPDNSLPLCSKVLFGACREEE